MYSRESDADARGNQYMYDVKKLLVRQTSYVGIESLVSSTKTLILTRLLERTQERVPSRRAQRKQYESRFDTARYNIVAIQVKDAKATTYSDSHQCF